MIYCRKKMPLKIHNFKGQKHIIEGLNMFISKPFP